MRFNDNIEMRLFRAEDAHDIILSTENEYIRSLPYFSEWAEANARGAGFTAVRKSDGKILGCGGIKVLWPECGEVWGIFSDEIRNHIRDCRTYSAYYLTALVKEMKLKRLQCIVDADKKFNLKFAEAIGFEVEGLLKNYRPDGDSYMLYYKQEPEITTQLRLRLPIEKFLTLPFRDQVSQIESSISDVDGSMAGDCFPLKHSFAKGLYVREISVPAGVVLSGKIHKYSHAFFLMKGEISILSEKGVKRIKAPGTFITPAGTKRIVYHHDDTVVVTVHSTNETNIEKIEDEIIAKTWEEYESIHEPLKLCGGMK